MQLERFADLAAFDPRLVELLAAAREADKGGPSFCANDAFYGLGDCPGFKRRIAYLVGWRAGAPPISPRDDDADEPRESLSLSEQESLHNAVPEVLCSQQAYDLVYDVILGSLPPCRDCVCVGDSADASHAEPEEYAPRRPTRG